jgi:hypothetical protein
MLKAMCQQGNIAEKTNHSLRATGVTEMFHAEILEKVIQKTTGHWSLKALRIYESISNQQHTSVSKLLMTGKPKEQIVSASSQPQQIAIDDSKQLVQQSFASDLSEVFGGFVSCSIGSVTHRCPGLPTNDHCDYRNPT